MSITNDRVQSLVQHARSVGHVEGSFAELGVFEGGVSELLARTFPSRKFFACDTFTGLPVEQFDKAVELHQPGEFNSPDSALVIQKLKAIPNVTVVKGLFPESATVMENERFAFVHLDFDFYIGTLEAIKWLLPRLNDGAIIAFDDFEWQNTSGVKGDDCSIV